MLNNKVGFLEKKIEQETEKARKFSTDNRRGNRIQGV